MLNLIIDGYNLIRQVPALSRAEEVSLTAGRQALIAKLQTYRRVKPHRVTVVFDGQNPLGEAATTYREGGLAVCFSSGVSSADDVIRELSLRHGAAAVVVTSDRQVADYSRAQGCAVVGAPEFYERLQLAEFIAVTGKSGAEEKDDAPAHKRWLTYKKGPSRRLPKKARRDRKRLNQL